MVGAGLLAKKAVERGLDAQAVGEDEPRARLEGRHRVLRQGRADAVPRGARLPHRRLRLHDLHRQLRARCRTRSRRRSPRRDLVACAVLSGNRNFEARIHPEVKANYLASPPLVVAYALAGRMDIDLDTEPLGQEPDGDDVYLADIWPTPQEIAETIADAVGERDVPRDATPTSSRATSAGASCAVPDGRALRVGRRLDLRPAARRTSTGMPQEPGAVDRRRRRALPRRARRLGDDRPHLARRLDQARVARRAAT